MEMLLVRRLLGVLRVVAILSAALAGLKRMVVQQIKQNVIRNLLCTTLRWPTKNRPSSRLSEHFHRRGWLNVAIS